MTTEELVCDCGERFVNRAGYSRHVTSCVVQFNLAGGSLASVRPSKTGQCSVRACPIPLDDHPRCGGPEGKPEENGADCCGILLGIHHVSLDAGDGRCWECVNSSPASFAVNDPDYDDEVTERDERDMRIVRDRLEHWTISETARRHRVGERTVERAVARYQRGTLRLA